MFHNFKDLVHTEVVRRLQPPVLARPRHWLPILSKRLKLQKRVVDAVKQHLVVDVLAFRDQHSQHLGLAAARGLNRILGGRLRVLSLALLLAALLKCQVQVKGQHLGEVLIEVVAGANLGVLELIQQLQVVLVKGRVQQFKEIGRINYYLLN